MAGYEPASDNIPTKTSTSVVSVYKNHSEPLVSLTS